MRFKATDYVGNERTTTASHDIVKPNTGNPINPGNSINPGGSQGNFNGGSVGGSHGTSTSSSTGGSNNGGSGNNQGGISPGGNEPNGKSPKEPQHRPYDGTNDLKFILQWLMLIDDILTILFLISLSAFLIWGVYATIFGMGLGILQDCLLLVVLRYF